MAEAVERRDKLLQFLEGKRADLVEWLAVERQFDDAVFQLPGQRLPVKLIHAPPVKMMRPSPSSPIPPALLDTSLRSRFSCARKLSRASAFHWPSASRYRSRMVQVAGKTPAPVCSAEARD